MSIQQDALLQQINKIIETKTFTADALAGIQEIKDKAAELAEANDRLQSAFENVSKERDRYRAQATDNAEQCTELRTQIQKAEATVKAGQEAITDAKVAAASAEAYKFCLTTVFKPTALREEVQRSVSTSTPVMGPNGYQNGTASGSEFHTTTTTTTKE